MNALTVITWTEERIEELRAYAAEGLTAAQIAHRMRPITELAIIGRAARLGIALGVKPAKAPVRRERVDGDDSMFGAAPPTREDAWNPLPTSVPTQLIDLNARQCPWPLGDAGATTAHCGAHKPEDLPYCRDHTALAYQGGHPKRGRGETAKYIRSTERRYA